MSDPDTLPTFETVLASANTWGRQYRTAVVAGDTAKVVGSATLFLNELGTAIPNLDENNDAKVLIFALITALTESMHGKHGHPLLQALPEGERVAGVEQRGLEAEYVAGIAAGAVVFLERHCWKTEPACRHISKVLEKAGVSRCGLSTVKKWRNEESLLSEPRTLSRRFVGIVTEPSADRAARDYRESGRSDPGAFIRYWLPEQVKAVSSLLGL